MYENYWDLETNPFESQADSRFFFHSDTHQAALLKLRYLVEQNKGAGLLVGGSGSGKTFLTSLLTEQLSEVFRPLIHLVFPQMSSPELLAYLAVELGAQESTVSSEAGGLDRTLRHIQQQLAHFAQREQHPVIVVDEAHLIEDPRAFQSLRLLLNFSQHNGTAFTLILAGQRELLSRVHRLPQLEERIGVQCVLRPLSQDETHHYVEHRLQAAGATRPIFEAASLDTVFELSGGIPRKINRLCDLALLVGYADNSRLISPSQVEAVSEELTVVAID